MLGYAYGGYSMHLPPTANTTKFCTIILCTVTTRRQLDKPLVWQAKAVSSEETLQCHIEQGGALIYRQF